MSPQCVICGQSIKDGEGSALTTTGEYIHAVCGDRQAKSAYTRRQRAAILHIFVVGALALSTWILADRIWAIGLVLAGLAAHLYLHAIWWRQTKARFRRWWILRRWRF